MAGVPIAFSEVLNVSQFIYTIFCVCFLGKDITCVKTALGNDRCVASKIAWR